MAMLDKNGSLAQELQILSHRASMPPDMVYK